MPPDSPLAARLAAARHELLDLGLRNPLLNFRPSRVRGVEVVGESSAAVWERLVRRGRPFTFAALPEAGLPARAGWKSDPARAARRAAALGLPPAPEETAATPANVPTEAARAAAAATADTADNQLQTAELWTRLESRLLNTYYTARTSLEEQGVNILYLALGMLTWYEAPDSPTPRRAPLVLVPVLLERGTAAERFRLRYTGTEVAGNLSLQARLKGSFGLTLPELEEDGSLPAYYAAVQAAVAGQPRWQVEPDAVTLGFFSFAKLLLYRDLDPATWPADHALLAHPNLEALLSPDSSFRDAPPTLDDTAFLDTDSPAAELHQVLDADSSQLLAQLAVHEGRNLVVQGPPGTGKSQTIANLLAEAIGAGKKVLFVAEKMAALDVVKRRLDALGLGVACLELHSHKTNKKAVLQELSATLQLGRPAASPDDQLRQLPHYRQTLNDYARSVHAPIGRSRRTAQQVAGELLHLAEERGPVELPRLPFPNLAHWTDADATRVEALAARLQATLQKTGPPRQLLFWGSELTLLLPADQTTLADELQAAQLAVQTLQTQAATLARQFGLPIPTDRAAAEKLLPAARHAGLAPPLAGVALADPAWARQAAHLAGVLQAGADYAALHQRYAAILLPEAWGVELPAERAALLTYGGRWWNFLSGRYRRARRRLQRLWRGPLPDDPAEAVAVIDAIHAAARHQCTLTEAAELAGSLFGAAWRGLYSDWPTLTRLQEYLTLTHQRIGRGELPPELLTYLAVGQPVGSSYAPSERNPGDESLPLHALTGQLSALETALTRHRAAVQAVVDTLQLNEARRFGPAGRLQFQPFEAQHAMLAAWAAEVPALRLITEWNNGAATVQEMLPELLLVAETWTAAPRLLAVAVRQTWLEYLLRQAYEQHPALRQFERASHEELLAHFRAADRRTLHHNRIRALRRHHDGLPHPQAGGQMRVLLHEFAKKTRHKPLRRLMQEAGRAVQAIKPVLLMSPLSVAGYLPPGAVEFDLVVFDEASQVKPVEALGAIARGRQLVVVGDSKQLPPTSFFDSLTTADEEADDENSTADIPSILELCKARQMPERMLRWHYRSRHESLIQPSNQLFYEDKLVIFPSPGGPEPLGLRYHHLPETYYERGTTRTNPLEAQAVAAAVLYHARATPRLTLGVVAFSTAQRQALQDALELLRRQYPETEAFFNRHPHEPFFIKNLENVQGDERDVILISLGYGRTRQGRLSMSFGPLNGEGGERRLNVLITRARQRCEVFTNLTADDLDLSRTPAQGVAALKAFLHFAQGSHQPPLSAAVRPREASFEAASFEGAPFEEAVRQALVTQGYAVRTCLGSPGFSLDLAVEDPDQPDRYILGLSSDGPTYQAARSARDRDRLRREVLEAMGWRLHYIWSTDWLRDPQRAIEYLVQAIEAARSANKVIGEVPERVEQIPATGSVEREATSKADQVLAKPYQLAQLPAAVAHRELHQHSLGQLATWLALVVRIESPVHLDEATRRLAQAGGATQVGARMRKAVRDAALLAVNLRYLRREGDFLWENTMQVPPLRDRSQLPAISRKLVFVAPEELALAVRTVVTQSFGLPWEVALLATVRLLGFSRLSDEMHQQLTPVLAGLLARGELLELHGILQPT